MDIDWAPDFMICEALELFAKNSVPCTIFATHGSKYLDRLGDQFEIGIHPNFNECLLGNSSKNASDIMDEILEIYPDSKGLRSHSMTQSSPLLKIFKEKGLIYDSNQFLPYQRVLPYRSWDGLIRIPYNWEDDIHYEYGHDFADLRINFETEFLIMDFHPVHLYLNTDSGERYRSAKKFIKNQRLIDSFRNSAKRGARDACIDAFKYCKDFSKYKMNEIASGIIK